jgi:hypothetical protein
MMDNYEDRLQLMKEMQMGIVENGGEDDDAELETDSEAEDKQPQPKKQMLKFGKVKEGTATVVEVQ